MTGLAAMLTGVMVATSFTAAVFFLKFWRRSRDRLFVIFAGAFAVLGAHWLIRGLIQVRSENEPYFYLVRLAAFILILIAITDKNRAR